MENNFFKQIFRGDKILWILYGALVFLSLFVTFSALTSLSLRVDSTAGPIAGHWMTIIIGLLMICLIQMSSFRLIQVVGLLLFILGLGGVCYVMMKGGGVGDAARHTSFGQPSELLMLGLILACAGVFNKLSRNRNLEERYFYYIAAFIMLCVLLILVDNLSTAALAMVSVFSMMVVSHIKLKRIGVVLLAALICFVLFMSISYIFDDEAKFNAFAEKYPVAKVARRSYTWKGRITRFVEEKGKKDKEEEDKYVIDPKNPQVADAKIAICKGGWFPHGPSSSQQRYHLAEAYSDYIFSIAAEEGGFLLGVVIMLIYLGVFWRAVHIIRQEQKMYRILLVTGCAMLIVTQAAVHIAVSVGAIPVTGQPLPLISKGGSSVVVISACFGIIAKVSASQQSPIPTSDETPTPE